MTARSIDVTDRLLPALYAIAFAFILTPVVDVITNVWPMQPGDIQWRFAFFGVSANYLISPLFGLGLLGLAAAYGFHKPMLLVTTVLATVAAVSLLACCLLYGLDILQLRGEVRPEAEFAFRVGAAKSLFKMVITAVALVFIAVGCFKARKDLRAVTRGPRD